MWKNLSLNEINNRHIRIYERVILMAYFKPNKKST